MIACEQEFLKAHELLNRLIEDVKCAGAGERRIDEVERSLFAGLLAIGFELLQAFVAAAGDGDAGETLEIPDAAVAPEVSPAPEESAPEESLEAQPASPRAESRANRTLRRLPEPHSRRYVSIFGELTITRFVYGTREGRKIEATPLDAVLGLPAGEFSYVLPDWQQRLCVKEAFGEATSDLKDLLGVAPSVRAAEVMNRQMSESAASFRSSQPPPPLDEEGEVVVFTADGKGVPMRRPAGDKPVVAVMDGEKALWQALSFFLPTAIGILDLFHVMERLWLAAHVFHSEGSPEAQAFVTDRLRRLLQGRVGGVIGGLQQMLTKQSLKGSKRKTLEKVIGYFDNNRSRMKYDEYLAAGYPIGSGVAEGACRHLVKDRMEQTGMRWTVEGAQSMLELRALYLNGQWEPFVLHRIRQEQQHLYPYKNALAA